MVIADLKRSFKRKRAQAEAQSTPPSPRNGSDTPSPTSEIATTQHIQIASPVITIQQQHPEEKRLRSMFLQILKELISNERIQTKMKKEKKN